MTVDINDLYKRDYLRLTFTLIDKVNEIITPDHEDGFGLIIKNISDVDAAITIKAGNSIYAMGDMEVPVTSGQQVLINLKNTGRFKNVYGENSGKVIFEAESPDLFEACAIAL